MNTKTECGTSFAIGRKSLIAALAAILTSLAFVTSVFAVIDPGSAATAQNTAGGGTTLTINKPSTTYTGDVLLAQITFHTGMSATLVPPPGWNEVLRTDNSTELGQIIYTKVAGPSEPESYTWTFTSGTTRAAGGIANYFGVDQTNPVGETSGNFGEGTTLTALSVEAENDSRLVLNLSVKESTTITTPSGLTFRFLQRQPTSGNLSIRAEDQARNAGPTGDRVSISDASDFWIAQQVILRADATSPSVTISSTASNPTSVSPIPITVQFSEPVNGFDENDVTVTNGSIGNFTGTFTDTYTFDLTPDGPGEITVNIAADVAQDATGNLNTAAAPFAIMFDSDSPTVTISSTAPNPTTESPIPVTVEFSEDVIGFEEGDIDVTNGTISNFMAVNGETYTFDLIPTAPGEVTVNIEAGVAEDSTGNPNSAAAPFSRIFALADTTAPTVTISSESTNPTSDSPIPVMVQFSEPVNGFEAGDIDVTNGTVSSFTTVDGDTYTFNLTPSAAGEVTVNIGPGVATDAAGNPNTAAAPFSITYVIADTTGPSVSVNQASGQADPTMDAPIHFTVIFSEPVNDFTAADVTLGGTAGATTAVVSEVAPNDGTTYDVAVSGMSASGTVIVTVAAGVATDAAGNPNAASTSTDNTVTFVVEEPIEEDFTLHLPYVERQ